MNDRKNKLRSERRRTPKFMNFFGGDKKKRVFMQKYSNWKSSFS